MYKGGYQIIDFSDYVFSMDTDGELLVPHTIQLDESYIPMFLSKKAKLFSNLSIQINGEIFSDLDDFFAPNTKTIVEGNTIRKYYHCHTRYVSDDSGIPGIPAQINEMEVDINTSYNTITMGIYYNHH